MDQESKRLEKGETPSKFSDVLRTVMKDPNYLGGSEPTGSNWNFSDWSGNDFSQFEDWVVADKYFDLLNSDLKVLSQRIIQIRPSDYTVAGVDVEFVIKPVTSIVFPTILIGTNGAGEEKVLRSNKDPVEWQNIPSFFIGMARELGVLRANSITTDLEGSDWALFLKNVLEKRTIMPSYYKTTDFMVRDRLELGPNESYSEKDRLLAEMQITQDELLMLAFADYVLDM